MLINDNNVRALGPFLTNAILMVTGEKGGCGKTTTTISIADALIEMGIPVHMIELDRGNPEVAKSFDLDLKNIPNVDNEAGWREVYGRLKNAPSDKVVIISTPGSMLTRAEEHCRSFLNVMPRFEASFGRPFRLIWVIDNKRDGMEYLTRFCDLVPDLKIDVVRNNFYGSPDTFKLFNESKIRNVLVARTGKIIDLPSMPTDLIQSMNNSRRSRQAFLSTLDDMLDQARFEEWWGRWIKSLKISGYIV